MRYPVRNALCTLSLLLCGDLALAQVPGPKGAILLSAGNTRSGDEPDQVNSYGIEYRRIRPNGKVFRIGLQHGVADFGYSSRIHALGVDSYRVDYRYSRMRYYGILGALEVERHFYKKVYMAAGLEATLGYGRQDKVDTSSATYGPSPNSLSTTMSGSLEPAAGRVQSYSLGVRPYIGARVYFGKRVLMGIDFGPSVNISYQFDDSYGIGNFDLRLFTGTLRLGLRL